MVDVWAGVDIGGTHIKAGLVTRQGRLLADVTLPTRRYATPARFLEGFSAALEKLIVPRGHGVRLRGVGVGAPGLIDARRGVIRRLVNVPGGWRGVPLKRLLERRLRCPCAIDNDVNAMALGEWTFGAGRGTRHSLYITLGTGVGGGLVIDGRLIHGVSGSAGEIGHMTIALDGPRCACGRVGCLEAFIGTAFILRRAREAMRRGSRILTRLVEREPTRAVTPELLNRAAAAGDRSARRIWDEVGGHLGVGLANLVNLLNPERIVIGGGVANAWRWFAPSMAATIRQQAFAVPAQAAEVVRARLGDRAGVVGASLLVRVS